MRRNLLLTLLFLSALLLIFKGETSAQWIRTNGPYFGAIRDITQIGDTLFMAAGYPSNIYQSTDEGLNWAIVSTPFSKADVGFVGNRKGDLLAGTSDGIFKSSDRGRTWVKKSNFVFYRIAQTPQYIFADGGGWVSRSSDDGDTWVWSDSAISNRSLQTNCIFASNDTVMIGTDRGIYYTFNLGRDWSMDTVFGKKFIRILKMIDGILYAGGEGLYVSKDLGAHWKQLNDTIFVGDIITGIVFINTKLIISGFRGIYLSTDSSKTFTHQNSGLNDWDFNGIKEFSGILFAEPWGDWLYRSSDTGKTWTHTSGGFPTSVRTIASTGGTLFSATNFGVYKSIDEGNTWIPRNIGLNGDYDCSNITIQDSFLFVLYRTELFRSSDNGENWTTLRDLYDVGPIFVWDTTLLLGRDYGHIDRSTDYGLTFNYCSVDSSNDNRHADIFCKAGNVLFAGSYLFPGIIRSTDNGISWFTISNVDSASVIALFNFNDTLLAGTVDKGIYRSTDMGIHWTASNNGIPVMKINVLAGNDKYIFAGTNQGVFSSSDGGVHWRSINELLIPDTARKINSLLVTDKYLYAGTDGEGVWKRKLADLAVPVSDKESNFLSNGCAPDPFKEETSLNIELKEAVLLHLDIFDVLGRKVFSDAKFFQEGRDRWTIEGKNLPKGTLYARVSTLSGEVQTIKLIHE